MAQVMVAQVPPASGAEDSGVRSASVGLDGQEETLGVDVRLVPPQTSEAHQGQDPFS